MILLVTALKIEADPFISSFRLKRKMSVSSFSIYERDEIALIISGTGKLRAAVAATLLMTIYGYDRTNTLLVNMGLCGCFDAHIPIGSCFQILKVSDMDTQRDYYPERFVLSAFPFQSLACYSHIVHKEDADINLRPEGTLLCDMESAGVMEAAARLLETHRVMMLKIVSDHLLAMHASKTDYQEMISAHADTAIQAILRAYSELSASQSVPMNPAIAERFAAAAGSLRLTAAMRQTLQGLLLRALQNNLDPTDILTSAADTKITSRSDRKLAYDRLLKELKEQYVSRYIH